MSRQNCLEAHIEESIQTQQLIMDELGDLIEFTALHIVNVLLADRKILSCGHATSVSNAQYFTSIMINRYQRERPSLPAISLASDVQILTSIASTQHYDDIFAKQLRALGQSGDVLLIYNTEGSELNLAKLINVAHDRQVSIVLLTADNELTLPVLLNDTDICISVPSQSVQRVQEAHLLMTHCLCDLIDSQLFGS